MKFRLISLLVAAALAATAQAADTPKASAETAAAEAAKRAELERARAELNRSARRVSELTRELGESGANAYSFNVESFNSFDAFGGRPAIGIVMGASPDWAGVRIAAVTPNGPAAKAGLRANDMLLSVDGKAISAKGDAAIEQARGLLDGLKEGQSLRLGYSRDGKSAQATVKAEKLDRVMVFSSSETPQVQVLTAERARAAERAAREYARATPVIDPRVQMEIARMAAAPCPPGDDDCSFPALTQAYRWSGLNLASMNPQLGRYFGTSSGVLVLSGGAGLETLEPGDVIQKIDGAAVNSPRDAMRALRDQDDGEKVKVDLLRERKPRTVEVTVPDAPGVRWYAPPAPPPRPRLRPRRHRARPRSRRPRPLRLHRPRPLSQTHRRRHPPRHPAKPWPWPTASSPASSAASTGWTTKAANTS
ncbi:PDZ domain-containing protein [Arenimonas daejeonensis]|uniref:PDZ domain-containing protein n=1 Tax=Arenimonas daejeonensis TaxID=370777 RepID=UPI0013156495|nr:PDZ domain-containing protein [Arenimonas daejeonensis]